MQRSVRIAAAAITTVLAGPVPAQAQGQTATGQPAHAQPATQAPAGPCDTDAAPKAFPAPAGASYVVYRRIDGIGRERGTVLVGPNLTGSLPATCHVDELGYNPIDGYLYALHDPGQGAAPRLLRIGRTPGGKLAVRTLMPLERAMRRPLADLVADVDSAGRFTLMAFNAVSTIAVVQRIDPTTGRTTMPMPVRWSATCAALVQNEAAQARLHFADPRLPTPEQMLHDWAFNPADGQFYGYATSAANPSYVGRRDPLSGRTVVAASDAVIAVDPDSGAARCAPLTTPVAQPRRAEDPSPAPSVAPMPMPTPMPTTPEQAVGEASQWMEYAQRMYSGARTARRAAAPAAVPAAASTERPADTRTMSAAAFTGPDRLALYEARGRQWAVDVSRCFTPERCRPTQTGETAGGSTDAAGNPYTPSQLTVRALTQGSGAVQLMSDQLADQPFGLSGGQARTFDVVPGRITLRRAPGKSGWQLRSAHCDRGDTHLARDGGVEAVQLDVSRQEHLVCTIEAITGTTADGQRLPAAAGERGLTGGGRFHARGAGARPGTDSNDDGGLFGTLPAPITATTVLIGVVVILLALGLCAVMYVVLPWQLNADRAARLRASVRRCTRCPAGSTGCRHVVRSHARSNRLSWRPRTPA